MTETTDAPTTDAVTKVARDLTEIENLSALLLGQAVHKANDREMPGGDAMVALGNVANLEAWGHIVDTALRLAYDHGDELPELDDEEDWWPPLQRLRFWTEDLRDRNGDDYRERYTVASEVGYLRHMLNWLWDNEPKWEDFARDIRKTRVQLENTLYAGQRAERTRVVCPYCDKHPRLVKVYARREEDLPADEHVHWWHLVDHHRCPNKDCRQRFDKEGFKRAHAKQLRSEGAERFVSITDAIGTLKAQGRPERTIRKWFEDCQVNAYCDPATRAVWVWWPDLWRLHLATATRRRGTAA